MMFMTPSPPSASVTMPTMLKNCFIVSTMRLNISVCRLVSHIAMALRSSASNRWIGREHAADVALERPVDVLDAPGTLVEDARHLVENPLLGRDDQICEITSGSTPRRGKSRSMAANGTKTLSLSGPL